MLYSVKNYLYVAFHDTLPLKHNMIECTLIRKKQTKDNNLHLTTHKNIPTPRMAFLNSSQSASASNGDMGKTVPRSCF